MVRSAGKLTVALALAIGTIGIGVLFSYIRTDGDTGVSMARYENEALTAPPTQMLAQNRSVILSTVTAQPSPTNTLRPAPTFEPPTATPLPTDIPSLTPTPTTDISVSIPGLIGAESPTPTTTPGCEARADWKLTYTVQFDDTLSSIADRYGTWIDELADGNCITDKNVITVGQVLHVPGDAQPYEPEVECVPWEVMTPLNGSVTVPADDTITFNWRGPASPLNLIRVYMPDGSTYERLVELRQNDTINLYEHLPQAGTYTWYVYPLDRNFVQIQCIEGGPWTFTKPVSSTATPTMDANTTPLSN